MKNLSFVPFFDLITSIIIFGVVSSCINRVEAEDALNNSNLSNIKIKFSEANSEYRSVVLDIEKLELTSDGRKVEYTGGSDNFNNGLIRLSDCTNGRDTVILNDIIPSGDLDYATLYFGTNSYIMTESGEKKKLALSEQLISGYKVDINAELIPSTSYTFLLGLNDEELVSRTENGEFVLNPELICKAEAGRGALQGRFNESKKVSKAYLVHSGDTLTAAPNDNGYFRIGKVPTGEYDLHVINNDSGKHHKIKEAVRVNSNTIKDVGSLRI